MEVFWIGVGAVALIALILLHKILLPFAVGAVAAYLLVPLVDRLERMGIRRTVAALGLVLGLASALIGTALVAYPVIVGELRFFIEQFPADLAKLQAIALDLIGPVLHRFLGGDIHLAQSPLEIASKFGTSWLDEALYSMWAGGLAILSLFSLAIVAPVVAIYLIIDWHEMIATIDGWLAPHYRRDVHALASEIHDTVSGFLRGQTVICLILATFYAISLRIIGINHGLMLGAVAGLISFVPYLGAATGLTLAASIALVQFWPNAIPALAVAGTFILGEAIADYVLAPRIIGRRVRLNPIWLIFALSAFGWLFGFVGLIIAVPLAASLRVIIEFAFRRVQRAPAVEREALPP
jgi:predicted PurR-regulated permease PerM